MYVVVVLECLRECVRRDPLVQEYLPVKTSYFLNSYIR